MLQRGIDCVHFDLEWRLIRKKNQSSDGPSGVNVGQRQRSRSLATD
jgi:hypothetical protein